MEKSGYNGVTYKETYGYDGFKEYLDTLTAYSGATQKAQNRMSYREGELSEVTDGKVRYGFEVDRDAFYDTTVMQVYDGSWKTLEETETDHVENRLTHKYYREDGTVTDKIIATYDKYGKVQNVKDGNEVVLAEYSYKDIHFHGNFGSPSAYPIHIIEDKTANVTTTYEYDENTPQAKGYTRQTTSGANVLSVSKESNSVSYTVADDTVAYKTQTITDAEKPGSSQVTYTTLTEGASETPKDILSWKYSYDVLGRLLNKTNKMGSDLWDAKYTYSYNTDNTLSGMLYKGSYLGSVNYLLLTTGCEYDKRQITKITETLETGPVDNRTSTTRVQNYTYDNHGRLKTAQIVSNGTVQSDNRYTYDNNGRLTQIYLAHNGLYRNQEYDDRGRIISSYLNTTSGGASDISYRYQYDNYGNRTAKTYYYGSNIIQSYEWERGRLLKNIKNTSGGVVGAYTYDVNGVRYTKMADGVTTTYFYNGNTLLGENRSDGTRLRYFYDATGICGFSYYNGSDTKYYTYVKDVLGNIVMIKDDMGLPLVKYTYNEWGVCSMTAFNLDNQGAAALELGNLNPFRYRGYYYDTESKLYYLMSRYYDPEIGRFVSPDTPDYLAPDTIGGVDLYAYGLNNPVMYVDPTGHVALWLGVLIAIGVVGLAVGGITATSSAIQGSSIGQVFLDGFLGVAIGVTSAGIIGCLIGVGYVLVTGVTVIGSFGVTLASLGAAAMFLGGYILAVLQGKEPGDSEAFPQPGYVPPWPPTTTGS